MSPKRGVLISVLNSDTYLYGHARSSVVNKIELPLSYGIMLLLINSIHGKNKEFETKMIVTDLQHFFVNLSNEDYILHPL